MSLSGTMRSQQRKRESGKGKKLEMIEASVVANKGNVGMIKQMLKKDAKEKRQHKCYGMVCYGFPWSKTQYRIQHLIPIKPIGLTSL